MNCILDNKPIKARDQSMLEVNILHPNTYKTS